MIVGYHKRPDGGILPWKILKMLCTLEQFSRNSLKSFSSNLVVTFVLFSKPLTLLPVDLSSSLSPKKWEGEEGLGSLPPLKTIAATPLVRLVNSKVKSGGEGEKESLEVD